MIFTSRSWFLSPSSLAGHHHFALFAIRINLRNNPSFLCLAPKPGKREHPFGLTPVRDKRIKPEAILLHQQLFYFAKPIRESFSSTTKAASFLRCAAQVSKGHTKLLDDRRATSSVQRLGLRRHTSARVLPSERDEAHPVAAHSHPSARYEALPVAASAVAVGLFAVFDPRRSMATSGNHGHSSAKSPISKIAEAGQGFDPRTFLVGGKGANQPNYFIFGRILLFSI